MSRPMLLVFLLLILIITSQFEWRQPLIDLDATQSLPQKQQQILKKEEAVKEKIILSQEKHIQRLNDLVRTLQQQLVSCKGSNETENDTANQLPEHIIEVQEHQILED